MPFETSPKTCGRNSEKSSLIYRKVQGSQCLCRGPCHLLRLVSRSCASETAFGAYRVFYYTKLVDSVLIFHAFAKKTQQTPPKEIALAQKRLKEMLDEKS